MLHDAAFHQGLHCLLRQKWSSEKYNLDYITIDPSLYTLDHPKFIVSNQMEEFISIQRVIKLQSRDIQTKECVLFANNLWRYIFMHCCLYAQK